MCNDDVLSAVNHGWKGPKPRRERSIAYSATLKGNGLGLTDPELCTWCIDGFLNVSTAEVVSWATSKPGISEFRPEVGTVVCKVIHVEARVRLDCFVDYLSPKSAVWQGWRGWNWTRWRKSGGVLVIIVCVAT